MNDSPNAGAWVWPRVSKGTWGPEGWYWLHVTAIQYPRDPVLADARRAFRRVWDFVTSLPCAECREHAAGHVVRSPPNLASSEAFQVWAWRFHNVVNARLGKRLVSYEEYRRLYAGEICRVFGARGLAV